MMKDMQKDINDLKSSSQQEQQHPHVFAQQPMEQQQQQRGRGQQQFNNFQPLSRSFSRGGQHRPQFDRPQFDRPQPPTDPQYEESCNFAGDIICYRCGQVGQVQYGCRVILDHQRRGGRGRYGSSNYRGSYGEGQAIRSQSMSTQDTSPNTDKLASLLVGSSSEVEVTICGVKTHALLDTGSNVTTIGRQFYKSNLASIPIQPLAIFYRLSVPMVNSYRMMALLRLISQFQVCHLIMLIKHAWPSLYLMVNIVLRCLY